MTHVSSASKVIEFQTMLPSPSLAYLPITCPLLAESSGPSCRGFPGWRKKPQQFCVSGQGTSYGRSQLCVLRELTWANPGRHPLPGCRGLTYRLRGWGNSTLRPARPAHTDPALVIPASSDQPPGPGLPVWAQPESDRPTTTQVQIPTAPAKEEYFRDRTSLQSAFNSPSFPFPSLEKVKPVSSWIHGCQCSEKLGTQTIDPPSPACHSSFREGHIVTAMPRGRGVSLEPPHPPQGSYSDSPPAARAPCTASCAAETGRG